MTTRDEDEGILALLRLRSAGATVNEIAKRTGLHPLVVKNLTNNVMAADIVYSDEPLADIEDKYW